MGAHLRAYHSPLQRGLGKRLPLRRHLLGDLGNGLYALAATNGKERGILITNIGEDAKEIETNLGRGYTAYAIDEKHFMTKKRISVKKFTLKQYDTLYLEKNL